MVARESDIAPENSADPYFRYSVDEWQNYVHDRFDVTFVAETNRAILDALLELKQNGTFGNDKYLIVWFSDSDFEVMSHSAKALNDAEVYQQYAAEFQ